MSFESIARVRYLNILFMTAPKEMKIDATQDGENWYEAVPWRKSPDNWSYIWWWCRNRFDPIEYASSMRLVLKGT
jgi:hypothetical protein